MHVKCFNLSSRTYFKTHSVITKFTGLKMFYKISMKDGNLININPDF